MGFGLDGGLARVIAGKMVWVLWVLCLSMVEWFAVLDGGCRSLWSGICKVLFEGADFVGDLATV